MAISSLNCLSLCTGVGDLKTWQDYLRRYPEAQPAVFGGDDGVADWVERYHAVGSGVVPIVAAKALLKLRKHFNDNRPW